MGKGEIARYEQLRKRIVRQTNKKQGLIREGLTKNLIIYYIHVYISDSVYLRSEVDSTFCVKFVRSDLNLLQKWVIVLNVRMSTYYNLIKFNKQFPFQLFVLVDLWPVFFYQTWRPAILRILSKHYFHTHFPHSLAQRIIPIHLCSWLRK